jgi:hypothetical protein
MPFSYLPPLLASLFLGLANWLDKRTAPRQAPAAWRASCLPPAAAPSRPGSASAA